MLKFQDQIQLIGIRTLNIYARVIMATTGSALDVSAPAWNQAYRTRITTNSVGENGKHGIPGPQGKNKCFLVNVLILTAGSVYCARYLL